MSKQRQQRQEKQVKSKGKHPEQTGKHKGQRKEAGPSRDKRQSTSGEPSRFKGDATKRKTKGKPKKTASPVNTVSAQTRVLKPGVPSTRLNKYISETGYCSRRQADELIALGKVKLNGLPAVLGDVVGPRDRVTINGKPVGGKVKEVYLAYNKPVGIECTTDERVRHNIVSAINYPERVFPIGRLDKESEGLILLTNNGDIVNPILRAGNAHEKEYVVSVDKDLSQSFLKGMASGVPILDTTTLPCKVDRVNKNTFRIVLVQGLNRQIRRMCEHFGYNVVSLKRVRIMSLSLGQLKPGAYRKLTNKEVDTIKKAVAYSSGTEEASVVTKQ